MRWESFFTSCPAEVHEPITLHGRVQQSPPSCVSVNAQRPRVCTGACVWDFLDYKQRRIPRRRPPFPLAMLRRLTLVLHATLIGICRALRLGPLRLWMRENVPAHREWDGHPVSDATLLHPNTDFAHKHWECVLNCSTVPRLVIDATCGNGHDSLVLVKALTSAGGGRLICCDIQQTSIDRSRSGCRSASGGRGSPSSS